MKTNYLKNYLLPLVLFLVSTVGISQTTFTVDGFTYQYFTNPDGTPKSQARLKSAAPGSTSSDLVIPETVSDGVNTLKVEGVLTDAFDGFGLTSVEFPRSIRFIFEHSFRNNQLKRVVFPKNITSIGLEVFFGNPLEEIIFTSTNPPSLGATLFDEYIDPFENRQNIHVVVPEDRVDVYKNQSDFRGFFSINGIYHDSPGRTELVNKIFYLFKQTGKNEVDISSSGPNVTKNLTINETVTINGIDFTIIDIRNAAFQNRALEKVTINSPRLKRIRGNAFRNNDISELTFGSNTIRLTDIEGDAFNGNQLTEVAIPASVTGLGAAAFRNNPLTEVSSLNRMAPSIKDNTFSRNDPGQINLKIPTGTRDSYLSAGWGFFKTIEGLFFINGQFKINGLIYKVTATDPNEVKVVSRTETNIATDIVIPETVSVGPQTFAVIGIDNSAFENASLTSVSIPNSVTSIGVNAFRGNQLTTVSIPNSVTSIGISAFRTNQLTSVTIGSSVNTIARNVFRSNGNLSSVVSNSSNPAIISDLLGPDDDPFGGIQDNIDLSVPIDAIQAYLDAGWTGFKSVTAGNQFLLNNLIYETTSTAPNEVQVIGGIPPSELTIPSTVSNGVEVFTVTSIATSALSNKNLTSVVLPNTLTATGFSAFSGNNLTSVVLPEGISIISKQSFQNNKLGSIELPSTTTIVDNNAFRNNPITEVTSLNTKPPRIEGSSFDNRGNIDLFIPFGTTQAYLNAEWTGFKITELESDDIIVAVKVFLQGASLNPNTGEENLMRDDLRVAGLLPTTSPYGGALTVDESVFETEGENAIVDWVFVQLRDATESSVVIAEQSALLQRDGDVVATDGVSSLTFTVDTGDYFIVINHRNHLGVITAEAVSLSSTATILDLTTNLDLVEGGNTAVAEVRTDVFGLITGDASPEGLISISDINILTPNVGSSGYSNSDLNMDSQILFNDSALINQNLGRGEQFSTSEP